MEVVVLNCWVTETKETPWRSNTSIMREKSVSDRVSAVLIHGELSRAERQARLAAYESGSAQVVVNVAVLTEGYDYTPTACVVLLRPSSYKSTFIQMVCRGLRTVDPQEFPGIVKTDCIVLDFGTASLMHGSLEQEVNLDGHPTNGIAPTKECPECEAEVPLATVECPLCGCRYRSAVLSVFFRFGSGRLNRLLDGIVKILNQD